MGITKQIILYRQTDKKKATSTVSPNISPHLEQPAPMKSSEIGAKQKETNEVTIASRDNLS